MSLLEQQPSRMLELGRCIFYKNIANGILSYYGISSEGSLRHAIHRLGKKLGAIERQAQFESNSLANLKNCFQSPKSFIVDFRTRIDWQLFNEQEAVFDVLCCPMRDILLSSGSYKALLSFCEEYHHGFIMGYTKNIGQCCLSEDSQFPLESSCHISCYFRPANMPDDARQFYFSAYEAPEAEAPKYINSKACAKEYYSKWAFMLVSTLIEENAHLNDSIEHVLAFSIRKASEETIEQLEKYASTTKAKLNALFVETNCLFFGSKISSISCSSHDEVAYKLIKLNFFPGIMEAIAHEQ